MRVAPPLGGVGSGFPLPSVASGLLLALSCPPAPAGPLPFVAVVPYSYFVHLVTTPLNVFFSKLTPRGEIRTIEHIEEAESLGISKLEEFSWKRRLDFDACVECGRCQDACPATMSGSALNPKAIIVKLKRYMLSGDTRPIHGEIIQADELWACTTCMACVQECPAHIDIVDTIIDLRRYLTLSEGTLPSTAPMSLQNIERAGNPWGLAPTERLVVPPPPAAPPAHRVNTPHAEHGRDTPHPEQRGEEPDRQSGRARRRPKAKHIAQATRTRWMTLFAVAALVALCAVALWRWLR